jgi:hypothetical protein
VLIMATGPEHYQRAERLLAPALDGRHPTPEEVARAQVHATLALAAATAMAASGTAGIGGTMDPADFQAWDSVCGTPINPASDD